MNKFTIVIISTITLLITSVSFWYMSNKYNNILEENNTIKELLLKTNNPKIKYKINYNKINEYIKNQNHFKNLWWHTIINQSGLSIIMTLIVLIVTITVAAISKQSIDDKLKTELEKAEEKNNILAGKLVILFSTYIKYIPESIAQGLPMEGKIDYFIEKIIMLSDIKKKCNIEIEYLNTEISHLSNLYIEAYLSTYEDIKKDGNYLIQKLKMINNIAIKKQIINDIKYEKERNKAIQNNDEKTEKTEKLINILEQKCLI